MPKNPPVYRIRNWSGTFESRETRGDPPRVQNMRWVRVPTDTSGDGYTELADHEDGAAHYGIWVGIVVVATRCSTRGTLQRKGDRAHTPETVARLTRFPVAQVEVAWERLIDIGWLERADAGEVPEEARGKRASTAREARARSEEMRGDQMRGDQKKRTRGRAAPGKSTRPKEKSPPRKRSASKPKAPSPADVEAIYALYPRKQKPRDAKKAIEKALERLAAQNGADPVEALRESTQAFRDSPAGQKPPKGEPDYRPYPATWFNSESYHDDRENWQRPNRRGVQAGERSAQGKAEAARERRAEKAAREHSEQPVLP